MVTQHCQYYLTPRKLSQKRKKYGQKITINQPLAKFFFFLPPARSPRGQIFSRTYFIMQIGSFKGLKRKKIKGKKYEQNDIEETSFWQGGGFLFSLMVYGL